MQTKNWIITGLLLVLLSMANALPMSIAEVDATASDFALEAATPDRPAAPIKPLPILKMSKKKPKFRALPVSPSVQTSRLLPIVDQKEIRLADRVMADEILRLLPEYCLPKLKNFYIKYTKQKSRGLGGASTIILAGTLAMAEKRAVLVHEALGHFMDLGCLVGNPESGASAFKDGEEIIYKDDPSVLFYQISWTDEKTRRENAKGQDFPSGYAYSADAFEDLAETVTMYVLQEKELRRLAKRNPVIAKKLAWVETHAFPKISGLAQSSYQSNGAIPWDTTKLAYEWVGTTRTELAMVE